MNKWCCNFAQSFLGPHFLCQFCTNCLLSLSLQNLQWLDLLGEFVPTQSQPRCSMPAVRWRCHISMDSQICLSADAQTALVTNIGMRGSALDGVCHLMPNTSVWPTPVMNLKTIETGCQNQIFLDTQNGPHDIRSGHPHVRTDHLNGWHAGVIRHLLRLIWMTNLNLDTTLVKPNSLFPFPFFCVKMLFCFDSQCTAMPLTISVWSEKQVQSCQKLKLLTILFSFARNRSNMKVL